MNPAFAMKLDCCMLISSLCFISATKRPFRRLCKLAQSNMDDILPSPALAAVPKNYIEFPFPYHQMIDLTIDDLSNLGSGVGRYTLPDGQRWVVMVPLALPGEIVKVKIFRNFKSYSEGDLIEILNPSKDRVKPECEYFEICGGCQYQHLSVSAQRDWKKKQVEELLVRIAGIEGVNVNDVVGTNEHYRYRSKITPHYDVPRKEGDLKIGFQKRGTRVMIDIPKCIITTDAINEKYLEVRTSIAESMKIKLPKKGATLLFRECEEGIETDPRAIVSQRVHDVLFRFKAGEFFQNNHFILPLMVSHVLSKASGDGCTHLIDAYCGSGLFSLCGAKVFETVTGVEVSDLAILAAKASAKENNILNAEFFCSSSEGIFKHVKHLPAQETCIVLDPPRKGCDDVFLKQLFEFAPRKIVYVSCDPSTQARDAQAIVRAGYTIVDVTPFDLFPQTRHIENVMVFLKNA